MRDQQKLYFSINIHKWETYYYATPKGGGAIAGIGEKFSMNPVTGTGSLSIPIFVSPGRSGFSPQLTLNYDSGSGNSSFGLGWSLGVPSITRKTQKGLPQYRDAIDSDIFLLSGQGYFILKSEILCLYDNSLFQKLIMKKLMTGKAENWLHKSRMK